MSVKPVPILFMSDAVTARFWRRVDKNGPTPSHCPEIGNCWLWKGALDKDGYGSIRIRPHPLRVTRVHHAAFFLQYGRWPSPCCLHRCDNPSCVRATHLFEGSIEDNNKDRARKHRSYIPAKGTVHFSAKVTLEQVAQIRKIIGKPQRLIAQQFGISQAQVSRIRTSTNWFYV